MLESCLSSEDTRNLVLGLFLVGFLPYSMLLLWSDLNESDSCSC